jgi:hypothetical protein
MSIPQTSVLIGFDLAAAGAGDFFTLDEPQKGELSGDLIVSEFPLAGDILEDVSEHVKSVSIRRGRSRQLEKFDAGAATIDLRNDQRLFDPSAGTAITPYGVSMRPRKELVIRSNGLPVFMGVVEDWDLDYSLNGDHIASVKASDQFSILANQVLPPFTVTQQSSGDRIEAVLDRPSVAWPVSRRFISPGKATLGTAVIEPDTNVLDYLQRVELSEPGALFVSSAGIMTFRDRADFQTEARIRFSDDDTGLDFREIQISYGIEEMKNRVTVELAGGGGSATSVNSVSVTEFGGIDFTLSDSLLSSLSQAENLAKFLVNTYGDPQVRVDSITVHLGSPGDSIIVNQPGTIFTQALTPAQVNRVLRLELGDLVEVFFTPSGIGERIERLVIIDSIEHEINPDEHIVRFNLSDTRVGFTLDSAKLGVLDVSKLGF